MAERLVEVAGEAVSGNEVFRRSWSSARPEEGPAGGSRTDCKGSFSH